MSGIVCASVDFGYWNFEEYCGPFSDSFWNECKGSTINYVTQEERGKVMTLAFVDLINYHTFLALIYE